jgi:hypothetical protein
LQDYLKGGASYVTHLLPSARNIDLLVAGGAPSVIVHVRDPRQWVVAISAHMRQYEKSVPPGLRDTTHGGSAETVAFAIQNSLPAMIEWLNGWVRARQKLNLHFTTFEELVRDKEKFLDRILSLYGGDTRFFNRRKAMEDQPGVDYHRRKGLVDEWKEVLTRKQIEHVNTLIPDEFWNVFGWDP